MSTGELRADGPGETRGGRAPPLPRPVPDVAVALGAGRRSRLGAYVIYPKDAPVAGTEAVQGVVVVASFTPNAIVANQTPDPQIDGFSLQIVVHAAAPVDAQWLRHPRVARPRLGVVSALPDAGLLLRRTTPPATRTSATTSRRPGRLRSQRPGDQHELRLTITVSGVGSNLSSNAEYITVLEPPMSFEQLAPSLPYTSRCSPCTQKACPATATPGTPERVPSTGRLRPVDGHVGERAAGHCEPDPGQWHRPRCPGPQMETASSSRGSSSAPPAARSSGSFQEFLDSRRKSGPRRRDPVVLMGCRDVRSVSRRRSPGESADARASSTSTTPTTMRTAPAMTSGQGSNPENGSEALRTGQGLRGAEGDRVREVPRAAASDVVAVRSVRTGGRAPLGPADIGIAEGGLTEGRPG